MHTICTHLKKIEENKRKLIEEEQNEQPSEKNFEDFKKKISPELRSRFDYKGMFNLLTEEDKLKFVHFRVNQIVDKYKEFVSTDLPERIHGEVVGAIDVTQFKNMRDLNKKIKDTFVERIKVSV